METFGNIVVQETVENAFNKRLINTKIEEYLVAEHSKYIDHGVALIEKWLQGEYYESKTKRLASIASLDLNELVLKMLVQTTYYQVETLFTAVSAQLAGSLGWSDKPDAIKTMAELLAVICNTDAYDICKSTKSSSLMLVSRLELTKEIVEFIDNSLYLPPMLVEPLPVTCNTDTGYLTFRESLVLGVGNHHEGDICLDVINTANSVKLKLDTMFVSKYEMNPTFAITSQLQQDAWDSFKKTTYRIMTFMAKTDNEFYLTHKVDKRGRLYSQGYLINSQGFAYQKAAIEFAEEESVEVPDEYRV